MEPPPGASTELPSRPDKHRPLSLALVKELTLTPSALSSLTPDEVADALLNQTSLHLEFAHLSGPVQGLDPFGMLLEVYLMGNRLTSVGDGFELCLDLRRVFLGHNRIPELGDGFRHLGSLEVLDLSCNLVAELPGYGRALPKSLSILDLSGNPATETEEGRAAHSERARRALPNLRILDGAAAGRAGAGGRMFVEVPMEEDDGAAAGAAELEFREGDDLWVVADRFCELNDVEGALARRQLVVWMKARAKNVYGVGVRDGEVTRTKMEETEAEAEEGGEGKQGEGEQGEGEQGGGKRGEGKQGEAEDTYQRDVQASTDRAMSAVGDFLASLDPTQEAAEGALQRKSGGALARIAEAGEREGQVSEEAVEEARELLRKRTEALKREKMEARRKAKETMREVDGRWAQVRAEAAAEEKAQREEEEGEGAEAKGEGGGTGKGGVAEGKGKAGHAGGGAGGDEVDDLEQYMMDELKENFENHVMQDSK
ncbi:hypothetical protein TeGR_g7097 [Tetraparma gracilis]|uniref:Uncharacterized protein n=1 Tax=Tetraparma gracilis TaxID=2962635 RepID=A0ABQ6MXJ5_9STRA|nr:hypothetical protein TeGR_g7097 [Tetraparma gracilis]